jgi:hypothetical protein
MSKNKKNVGLVDKYLIIKLKSRSGNLVEVRHRSGGGVTASPGQGDLIAEGRLKRSWCFVLSPEKADEYGAASRAAMVAYANEILRTNPRLANDIRARVRRILDELPEGSPGEMPEATEV